MKIKEYLDTLPCDIDTYDKVFDAVVTCCQISDEEFKEEEKGNFKYYYRFIKYIYENVDVIDPKYAICNWAGFVEKNIDVFQKFMEEHWIHCYTDKDDFIYQWIKEIHLWLAGYSYENNYKCLLKMLEGES